MTQQQSTSRDARHRAARLEDVVNRVVVRHLAGRGWRPRVVAYPCYGSAAAGSGGAGGAGAGAGGEGGGGWVRVLGRVLLTRSRPGQESPEEAEERHQLLRGWRSFVTAPVAGARVAVDVGGQRHVVAADRGGYVDAVVPSSWPAGEHEVRLRLAPDTETVDVGAAHTPVLRERRDEAGERVGPGEVHEAPTVVATAHVVGRAPVLGVVSDIDDTVMVTSLPRPLIAAWNTFVLHERARTVVTGMADLYDELRRQNPGAPVVYVSTGAWNVAPTLRRFLLRHHFPPGPLLLTDWGPTNSGWFRSGRQHKHAALRRLVRELPQVRWLLVGDDGQHDPQLYADLAREHPEHVAAIAIRRLSPAEQVLSHGLPVPVSGTEDAGVPAVSGGDGYALAFALRRVLLR